MSRRVLAISAHPDDETLGCGGTLLRHRAAGDEVSWLIVTAPWTPLFDEAWIARRQTEIEAVAAAYGMVSVHRLDLPTTRLDGLPLTEVMTPMEKAIDAVDPDLVYVVHRGDVHSDHRVVFDAAVAVLKPFRRRRQATIHAYECPSSTNLAPPSADRAFLPQVYCDISGEIERKLEILALYESEVLPAPHPRSLEAVRALARYRGSAVAVDHAEAFMVVRALW